jgi:hypothetical protein
VFCLLFRFFSQERVILFGAGPMDMSLSGRMLGFLKAMYIHQLESIIIYVIMTCLVHIEVFSFMWMLRWYIDSGGEQ